MNEFIKKYGTKGATLILTHVIAKLPGTEEYRISRQLLMELTQDLDKAIEEYTTTKK